MSLSLIINADDCGMSSRVNSHIEAAITQRKITSTTVMANMDDFEGAVKLYKKYNDEISFGWHINLTEGAPLLYSQLLLDKGFYKEYENGILMNGKAFWKKNVTSQMKSEIKKELTAQYEKIRDNGIKIAHVDSHHHVHTRSFMLFILPEFLGKNGITKVRTIRTNINGGIVDKSLRRIWRYLFLSHNRQLEMPDFFCDFTTFINNRQQFGNCILELECHPGHPKYEEEEELLFSINFSGDDINQLCNYKTV